MGQDGYIPDIEQQLLGAILAGGEHRAVFAMVRNDQLVEPVHQAIFAAARVAHDRFSRTTIPTVVQLLPSEVKAQFKTATGRELAAYMAECTSATVYGVGTATRAARNVLGQWARLRLASEARLVATAADAPDADPVTLLRELASTVDDIGSSLRSGGRQTSTRWIGAAADDALAAAVAARDKGGLTGITTGLADLDRLTGGLQRGDLVLLGARPSMGKTSIATSIALSAARKGSGVGVFSLEMGADKVTTRMLSDMAYRRAALIPYEAVITGNASDAELEQLAEIASEFHRMPIRIEDAAGLTISDIRAKVEGMVAEFEAAGFTLDALVIDHLLKVRPTGRYSGNRVLEIGEITEGLKELAREFSMPVLLLTQLNRAVEQRDDKRPTLADLRDSGAIEQDADAVMFLYRESYYLAREKPSSAARQIERDADLAACINKAEVEIAKQRNGRLGTVELFTEIGCSYFGNAARHTYGEDQHG